MGDAVDNQENAGVYLKFHLDSQNCSCAEEWKKEGANFDTLLQNQCPNQRCTVRCKMSITCRYDTRVFERCHRALLEFASMNATNHVADIAIVTDTTKTIIATSPLHVGNMKQVIPTTFYQMINVFVHNGRLLCFSLIADVSMLEAKIQRKKSKANRILDSIKSNDYEIAQYHLTQLDTLEKAIGQVQWFKIDLKQKVHTHRLTVLNDSVHYEIRITLTPKFFQE